MRKTTSIASMLAAAAMIVSMTACSQTPQIAKTGSGTDTANVTETPVSGVAAKTSNFEVTEQEVADYIAQYRLYSGVESDRDWASLLDKSGLTVEEVRSNAIKQIALTKQLAIKAEELGISVGDDEVKALVDERRKAVDASDDATWTSLLQTSGYKSSEIYENDIKNEILLERLYDMETPPEEISEAQLQQFSLEHPDAYLGKKLIDLAYPADASYKASNFTTAHDENMSEGDFRKLAAAEVDSGAASKVADLGWSCLSTTLSSYAEASIADAHAGQCVSYQESDGTYHILFIADEFAADRNGYPTLEQMPTEIRKRLESDYENTRRIQGMSEYSDRVISTIEITENPMPANAPYNVDIVAASEYGKETTQAEDAAASQKLVEEHINELNVSGYDSNGNLVSESLNKEQ